MVIDRAGMTDMTDTQSSPQEWPAAYPASSAGGGSLSLMAIFVTMLLVSTAVAFAVPFKIEWQGRGSIAKVAAAQPETPPSPTPATSASAAATPDMDALAPEFGTWLLKHPEINDRAEKLQQSMQSLCASINALCSGQAKRFDAAGACKNRPTQCAQ
jgi:hypothetical protein